ncbi:hypothetical protein ACTSKR_11310 [Chitinibacteraceae bacterium HSL-7]
MANSPAVLATGNLYVQRYNDTTGLYEAEEGPFEVEKFEITVSSELKEKTSRSRDNYGQVIASVVIPGATEIAITWGEVNTQALSLALAGDASAKSQAAGVISPASALSLTAKISKNVPTGFKQWTAGVVVTDDTAATTYVLGTDYTFDYADGTLKALEGGAITEAQAIKVSGSYVAYSYDEILGAKKHQLRAKFRLSGKNLVDGSAIAVYVPEAVMRAEGGFDFMADDFVSVEMTGRLVVPPGEAAAFTVERQRLA